MMNPSTNRARLEELFSAAFRGNGVVLALGAGVNGKRIPQWQSMIRQLLEAVFLEHGVGRSPAACTSAVAAVAQHFDVYAQASIAEAIDGPERLRARIGSLLYRSHDDAARTATPLGAVAALCQSGCVRAVLIFNYDTFLEQALARLPALPFQSIDCLATDEAPWVRSRKGNPRLPIYHVHGLIPPANPLRLHNGHRVVLSQGQYLSLFARNDEATSHTPFHLLQSYRTIFIGCSLNDWNMIRLLRHSRPPGAVPHFALARSFRAERNVLPGQRESLDRLRSTLWHTLGVRPVYFSNFAQIVRAVAKCAAQARPSPSARTSRLHASP